MNNRAEVETFKIQNSTNCFSDADGCLKCMNYVVCDWYLSFSRFLDLLDLFLSVGF